MRDDVLYRDGRVRSDVRPDNPLVSATLNQRLMSPAERLAEARRVKDLLDTEEERKQMRNELIKKQKTLERLSSDGIPPLPCIVSHLLPQMLEFEAYENNRIAKHNMSRYAVAEVRGGESKGPEQELFQHRRVNAEQHFNFRFLDTQDRLWPQDKTAWTVERANKIRSYDVRGRNYNPINHCYNDLGLKVRETED